MTIWFVAAAVVLIVELFIGTVYLFGGQRSAGCRRNHVRIKRTLFCRRFDRRHHQRTRYLAGTRPSENRLDSPSAQR